MSSNFKNHFVVGGYAVICKEWENMLMQSDHYRDYIPVLKPLITRGMIYPIMAMAVQHPTGIIYIHLRASNEFKPIPMLIARAVPNEKFLDVNPYQVGDIVELRKDWELHAYVTDFAHDHEIKQWLRSDNLQTNEHYTVGKISGRCIELKRHMLNFHWNMFERVGTDADVHPEDADVIPKKSFPESPEQRRKDLKQVMDYMLSSPERYHQLLNQSIYEL